MKAKPMNPSASVSDSALSILLGIFIRLVPFALATAPCSAAKPNIIAILVDDQGLMDIGYNNPGKVYTPTLDKLAAEGAVFERHYSMPQCTPTRVAMLTGRYPGRFGNRPLVANNDTNLPPGTPTIASLLKQQGYSTSLAGKWHISTSPNAGPNRFGFDHSYGSFSGAVGMYDHRYRPGPHEATWHRDHKIIDGYENGTHATDLVAREAVRIIETSKRPFFLYLPFHAPHTPLDERGKFTGRATKPDPGNPKRWLNEDEIEWFNDPAGIIQKEPDPEKRLLLATVYHLDSAIGEIIAALDRSGQRENTLILYSSDNGPQGSWPGNAYPDDLRVDQFNQPLPIRGIKTDVWEGGIHVPGFANWPGRIKPKRVATPVHVIDWLPTLASVAGANPGPEQKMDGVDLSPLLFGGEKASIPERDLYWLWGNPPGRRALRRGDWKIVRYAGGEPKSPADWQLFNLAEDPKEKTNVAGKHPELLKKLHEAYLEQRSRDQVP